MKRLSRIISNIWSQGIYIKQEKISYDIEQQLFEVIEAPILQSVTISCNFVIIEVINE